MEGDSEKASGRVGKQIGKAFRSGTSSACAGLDELLSSVKRTMAAVISVKAVGEAVPAGLSALGGVLDVLQAAAEGLEPYGEWLWKHFLQPLGESTVVI